MKMRKWIAVLIAALLALTPVVSFAEDESVQGYLNISNPVLTVMEAGGAENKMDFTGLELKLKSGLKASEAGDFSVVAALDVLGGGASALSASAKMENFVFLASVAGISKAFKADLTEYSKDFMDQFKAKLAETAQNPEALMDMSSIDFSGFLAAASKLEPEQLGKESVEMIDGQLHDAEKIHLAVSPEQSREIANEFLKGLQSIKGMVVEPADLEASDVTVDITAWENSDENLARTEVVVTVVKDGETVTVPVTVLTSGTDETSGKVLVTGETPDGDFSCEFEAAPAEGFEGETSVNASFNMVKKGDESNPLVITYAVWPEMDGDMKETLMSMSMNYGGEQMDVGAYKASNDKEFALSFTVGAGAKLGDFSMSYTGEKSAAENSADYDGTLNVSFNGPDGSGIYFETKLGVGYGQGLPEIANLDGMESIDLMKMTDADTESLTEEAQGVLFSALGALYSIPGVAALLESSGM